MQARDGHFNTTHRVMLQQFDKSLQDSLKELIIVSDHMPWENVTLLPSTSMRFLELDSFATDLSFYDLPTAFEVVPKHIQLSYQVLNQQLIDSLYSVLSRSHETVVKLHVERDPANMASGE